MIVVVQNKCCFLQIMRILFVMNENDEADEEGDWNSMLTEVS